MKGMIKNMKQNDISDNLEQWNKLDRYSEWMYRSYSKYVGKRVLDIGAGVGNLTQYLVKSCECVIGVDIFEHQINSMKKRFIQYENFEAYKFNILEDDLSKFINYKFDTIVCINVLEHLEDDLLAINKMKSLIVKGGKLIILVPACSKLYSHLDKNVGHHRRYDKGQLKILSGKCNMKIVANKYFNFWGIIPYYLKGKISKDKGGSFSTDLNETNSKFYNKMSTILEPIENIFIPTIGLSEIMVLEKK